MEVSSLVQTHHPDILAPDTLWLSNNHLTGTIATEIGMASTLSESSKGTCFSQNGLDVSHFVHFTAEYLYLDSNSLTGDVPSEIGLLTNLSE